MESSSQSRGTNHGMSLFQSLKNTICSQLFGEGERPLSFLEGKSDGNGSELQAKSKEKLMLDHNSDLDDHKDKKCSKCGEICRNKVDLERHLRKHVGEKPFKCSLCNKGFSRKSSKLSHERIHSGVKQHKCDQCTYACNELGNLKKHKLCKHSQKRNFKCRECEKRFKTQPCIRSHYRNVHTSVEFTRDCVIKVVDEQ